MSTRPQFGGSYVVESSASENDRLVRVAQAFDEHVQDGWRRAGLGGGARVIDVGWGPLGALLSLANLVGPNGRVVGLDFNAGALATAETILTQRGLTNVQLSRATSTPSLQRRSQARGRSTSPIVVCS